MSCVINTSCLITPTFWDRLFKSPPRFRHIWREDRRELLGSYVDFVCSPYPETLYRVAVHCACVRCGEIVIQERTDVLPP